MPSLASRAAVLRAAARAVSGDPRWNASNRRRVWTFTPAQGGVPVRVVNNDTVTPAGRQLFVDGLMPVPPGFVAVVTAGGLQFHRAQRVDARGNPVLPPHLRNRGTLRGGLLANAASAAALPPRAMPNPPAINPTVQFGATTLGVHSLRMRDVNIDLLGPVANVERDIRALLNLPAVLAAVGSSLSFPLTAQVDLYASGQAAETGNAITINETWSVVVRSPYDGNAAMDELLRQIIEWLLWWVTHQESGKAAGTLVLDDLYLVLGGNANNVQPPQAQVPVNLNPAGYIVMPPGPGGKRIDVANPPTTDDFPFCLLACLNYWIMSVEVDRGDRAQMRRPDRLSSYFTFPGLDGIKNKVHPALRFLLDDYPEEQWPIPLTRGLLDSIEEELERHGFPAAINVMQHTPYALPEHAANRPYGAPTEIKPMPFLPASTHSRDDAYIKVDMLVLRHPELGLPVDHPLIEKYGESHLVLLKNPGAFIRQLTRRDDRCWCPSCHASYQPRAATARERDILVRKLVKGGASEVDLKQLDGRELRLFAMQQWETKHVCAGMMQSGKIDWAADQMLPTLDAMAQGGEYTLDYFQRKGAAHTIFNYYIQEQDDGTFMAVNITNDTVYSDLRDSGLLRHHVYGLQRPHVPRYFTKSQGIAMVLDEIGSAVAAVGNLFFRYRIDPSTTDRDVAIVSDDPILAHQDHACWQCRRVFDGDKVYENHYEPFDRAYCPYSFKACQRCYRALSCKEFGVRIFVGTMRKSSRKIVNALNAKDTTVMGSNSIDPMRISTSAYVVFPETMAVDGRKRFGSTRWKLGFEFVNLDAYCDVNVARDDRLFEVDEEDGEDGATGGPGLLGVDATLYEATDADSKRAVAYISKVQAFQMAARSFDIPFDPFHFASASGVGEAWMLWLTRASIAIPDDGKVLQMAKRSLHGGGLLHSVNHKMKAVPSEVRDSGRCRKMVAAIDLKAAYVGAMHEPLPCRNYKHTIVEDPFVNDTHVLLDVLRRCDSNEGSCMLVDVTLGLNCDTCRPGTPQWHFWQQLPCTRPETLSGERRPCEMQVSEDGDKWTSRQVVLGSLLQLWISWELGLQLLGVHEILTWDAFPSMRPFSERVAEVRVESEWSDFLCKTAKLLGNSVYGRGAMTSVGYKTHTVCDTNEALQRMRGKPGYHSVQVLCPDTLEVYQQAATERAQAQAAAEGLDLEDAATLHQRAQTLDGDASVRIAVVDPAALDQLATLWICGGGDVEPPHAEASNATTVHSNVQIALHHFSSTLDLFPEPQAIGTTFIGYMAAEQGGETHPVFEFNPRLMWFGQTLAIRQARIRALVDAFVDLRAIGTDKVVVDRCELASGGRVLVTTMDTEVQKQKRPVLTSAVIAQLAEKRFWEVRYALYNHFVVCAPGAVQRVMELMSVDTDGCVVSIEQLQMPPNRGFNLWAELEALDDRYPDMFDLSRIPMFAGRTANCGKPGVCKVVLVDEAIWMGHKTSAHKPMYGGRVEWKLAGVPRAIRDGLEDLPLNPSALGGVVLEYPVTSKATGTASTIRRRMSHLSHTSVRTDAPAAAAAAAPPAAQLEAEGEDTESEDEDRGEPVAKRALFAGDAAFAPIELEDSDDSEDELPVLVLGDTDDESVVTMEYSDPNASE